MTGAEVAEKLARWHAEGRTGALEWRDGRRRRLFYFEDGALTLVQSNLKSESPTRLAEERPDLDPEALRSLADERRVVGALGELEGEVTEHLGVPSPEHHPIDILAALWAGADLLPRPAPERWVRATPDAARRLHGLPVEPAVRDALLELDGQRTIEDVTGFGPAAPDLLENAIALAVLLGAVDASVDPVPATRVLPHRTPGGLARPAPRPAAVPLDSPANQTLAPPSLPPPPPVGRIDAEPPPRRAPPPEDEPTGLDDIAALISGELRGSAPTPGAAVLAGDEGEGPSHEVVIKPRAPSVADVLGAAASRIERATNHYEVLGRTADASPDDFRQAYLQLARDLHPDRWSSASAAERDAAERTFERVRAAWEVLGNDAARRAYYDRVVNGVKSEEELAQERIRLIMEAESEFKRGMVEFQSGRMVQAHDLFRRASDKVPEDLEMQAYAGFTSFKVNVGRNDEKAEAGAQAVVEAIRANERFDQGYVLLGLIHWARGDEAQAKASFVQALRIRPANPDALRELKRLQRSRDPDSQAPASKEAAGAGFFSRLFGKK